MITIIGVVFVLSIFGMIFGLSSTDHNAGYFVTFTSLIIAGACVLLAIGAIAWRAVGG